jgi:hypothetical protein
MDDGKTSRWRRLVIPTRIQLAAYFVGSCLINLGANYKLLFQRWLSDPTMKSGIMADDYLRQLDKLANFQAAGTAVIVIFWSGVGLAAYTIVWVILNAVIEARNEVVIETEYTNKGLFQQRLKGPLIQAGLALALFVWLILNALYFLPLAVQHFGLFILLGGFSQWPNLILPLLGLTADLYILSVLAQAVFRAD